MSIFKRIFSGGGTEESTNPEDPKPEETDAPTGMVSVGWLLSEEKASVIFYPPERLKVEQHGTPHGKSVARCPAILGLEARHFIIRSPFDLNLRFGRTKEGKAVVQNAAGNQSALRPEAFKRRVRLQSEAEWRKPGCPVLQVTLPYIFIADEPVWISQLPAFAHWTTPQRPGLMLGGRFPIDVWPRALMWAFEWRDLSQPLIVKRGDPLFYVSFEASPPSRPVKLIEAERTEELSTYMERISGAVDSVNQTFSLFDQARRFRPETLLKPVKR
ncbi:MAG: hypothetical protein AAGE89_07480 [Pseudomonadota bacterium]